MTVRKINISDAEKNLPLLIQCVTRGEHVMIDDGHGHTFDLVEHKEPWRPHGSMYEGLYDINDGYEEKLPDYSW